MTKAIAQNISLFSYADTFSIRGDERRQEAAEGGVFATVYMLKRRMVSCPKGSTIKIMSRNLTGEEIADLAVWAAPREIFFEVGVSFEGLTSEHFANRNAAYVSLATRDGMAAAYGMLITALDTAEEAREFIRKGSERAAA